MANVLLASGGYDHTIRFWEAKSGTNYRTLQYGESQINKLVVTPDKRLIAAAGNPHIKLFDLTSNHASAIFDYNGHTSNVTALGFQREQKWMYSASEDCTVKVWDLRAPGAQRDFQREFKDKTLVNCLVLHPCQVELVAGYQSGQVRLWDLGSSKCSHEFVVENGVPVRCVALTNDGQRLFVGTNTGLIHVFAWPSSAEATKLSEFQAHKSHVLQLVTSPDQTMLATMSSDHTVKIWSLDSLTLQQTLAGHTRWVWEGVFSSDSAYLVTASSDTYCRLWDLSKGDTVVTYKGHQKAVVCVALSDPVAADST